VNAADGQARPETDAPLPVGSLPWGERATVEGRVRSVSVGPLDGATALTCELFDATGGITLIFYGRRAVPGIQPGVRLRASGVIGEAGGVLAITNPDYLLIAGDQDSDGR
jgi:hypothetical protein